MFIHKTPKHVINCHWSLRPQLFRRVTDGSNDAGRNFSRALCTSSTGLWTLQWRLVNVYHWVVWSWCYLQFLYRSTAKWQHTPEEKFCHSVR